jgi:hypothetical protein
VVAVINSHLHSGSASAGPRWSRVSTASPSPGPWSGCGSTSTSAAWPSPVRSWPTPAASTSCPVPGARARPCAWPKRPTTASPSTWPRSAPRRWSTPGRRPTAGSAPRSCPSRPTPCSTPSGTGPQRPAGPSTPSTSRPGGAVRFGDDLDELMSHHRPGVAFSLGAMGSPRTNFYNDAYRRAGFEQACREVQRLWVEGRRDEAVAAVPDYLVLQTNCLGDEASVQGPHPGLPPGRRHHPAPRSHRRHAGRPARHAGPGPGPGHRGGPGTAGLTMG